MSELTFHGVDIGLLEGGEDLVGLILEATGSGEHPTLQDGDVLVVASKVVSLAEGRYVGLESVPVSPRAERIADRTGIDPREVELILRESDVVGSIPVDEIGRELLAEYAASAEGAEGALETLPSLLVTVRNGRLCTNAGIDMSNSPAGTATLLPDDPDASARRIREAIRDRADVDVAVILSDSEVSYRGGSVDVAIGCAGIDPVDHNFGATDLFGEPKLGGVDLVADELAAGAALLAGQTDERMPVVVARDLEYEDGGGIGGEASLVREGLLATVRQSVAVKLAEKLPLP
ncbi:coenzyme F420-0:L-glutamate ligase [Natrialbaceae archaeon AArc-T1-2]|uniref:coenzyme F420-0:L-glutamate ligase n=1 Tax=Natrialbaceae archaeon AArc-T1-2 TaxID=3053904 RepID=UPI00255B1552|nr:coenzyme F420-0:L-glutamate ligase [Natrialbaceae archaeon AArc-T1-2]WIV68478.1 coenzyme F420-0:L-glutamate ligase [Natrialbaceae archaeon AArc-T1-2]